MDHVENMIFQNMKQNDAIVLALCNFNLPFGILLVDLDPNPNQSGTYHTIIIMRLKKQKKQKITKNKKQQQCKQFII